MRILITGGCGFLGHHLVEHFLKTTEADLVILDKFTYASAGLDRLRDIKVWSDPGLGRVQVSADKHPRVRIIGCDLSRPIPEGVTREVGQIDYVIHAAAETHVDNSIVDPMPFIRSNVEGTHHLLWWLQQMSPSVKRVFMVSTDEVYGPAAWDSPGNVETDMYRPANPYAAAKGGGEMLAFAYANTYRHPDGTPKAPVTIVNTMNLYGERQGAEKFIPLVIRRVLAGEAVMIHADASRTRPGTRFYIHCRNYASALSFLIEQDYRIRANALGDGRAPGEMATRMMPLKIHVSGEREISNLDLAQMIAGYVGKPLMYELVDFHSSRPGHDLRYALDDSKIRGMGWKQPIDIDESLRRTVQWFLDNPKWLQIGIGLKG